MRNGISVAGLSEFVHEGRERPDEARISYRVDVGWDNATRMEASTGTMKIGPHRVARSFSFPVDEPRQIGGLNTAPTPQEYLLGGVAGCMAVAYVMGASMMGIRLSSLDISIEGELDLRGFMGLDEGTTVGFEGVRYVVTISGDGTDEQFRTLHDRVTRGSPNRASLAQAVPIESELVVLRETPETEGVFVTT